MPEPIPTLYSLGVAPFSSGFLSNLLDTIGLPAKHIFSRCLLLYNQPSLDQQLSFQADYEHFHFYASIHVIVMIRILSMDRPAVDLRLPKLLILFAAFRAAISSRQLQTFIPTMSEERTIPM